LHSCEKQPLFDTAFICFLQRLSTRKFQVANIFDHLFFLKVTPISTPLVKDPLSFPAAFGALLLGGVIMGFSPVFVREAEVGAIASAFWRVMFALPVLLAWVFWSAKRSGRIFRLQFTIPAIMAGIMFAGDLSFWHLSILNTTLANATFLTGLAPVWVILFSNLLLKEKPPRNALLGIVICLFGMGLLINASLRLNPEHLIGDFYGVITSFFLGFYIIAIRTGTREMDNGALFTASTIVTTLILLVVALMMGGQFFPDTGNGWLALASLGIFTHAGGQGLLTIAIAALTAAFSSLVIFIEAIAAAFFGWLLFDETLDALQILGCVLILSGIWISRPNKIRSQEQK
jgi:drug/metabolite transporter (DMT)-like permease